MQRIALILMCLPLTGCALASDWFHETREGRLEAQSRRRDAPIYEPYTVWRPVTEYRKAYPVYMHGEELNCPPEVAVQYHIPKSVVTSVAPVQSQVDCLQPQQQVSNFCTTPPQPPVDPDPTR